MITRKSMYESFRRYFNNSIEDIEAELSYYNNRLTISNGKLSIYNDTLSRNATEFSTIYGTSVKNIDTESTKISYVNKVSIVSNPDNIVKALSKVDKSYGIHTVLFVKSIVESYYAVTKEIRTITRAIQILNDKISFLSTYRDISPNIFYYLISKCNKYYEKALLNGETIMLGHHLGFIKVVPRVVKPKINWDESLAYKARIISEGKTPYNKKDAAKAKKAGIPYDGVKWFIYYENETQHYINWYAYSPKLPNKDAFSFTPARYNRSGKTISEIKSEVSDINDLDNYKIGIVNKLNIGLDINEMQFIKYAKDDLQISRSR